MKIDAYTKIILTIIAVNLLVSNLNNLKLFKSVYAESHKPLENAPEYVALPLSSEGVVEVHVKSFQTTYPIDINIERIGGQTAYGKLDIELPQPLRVKIDD